MATTHPIPAPAKPLAQGEAKKMVQAAFRLERKIVKAAGKVHGAEWELAEALYEFTEIRGWERLSYETLNEFLAQPDLGISRAYYFRLVASWRVLAVERKVAAPRLAKIEPSKVQEILPAVTGGKVKVDDALDDAEALGCRDLREKYAPQNIARHGQQPDDSTALDGATEPVRKRCSACGGSGWITETVIDSTAEEG